MDNLVRILGIDPGTANCGYATIEGDLNTGTAVLLPSRCYGVVNTSISEGNVRERIDRIGEDVKLIVRQHSKPTHIAIEDFTEQGKRVGKTYKEMAWITEHLRMIGRELGYDVDIYENGYWKKHTLGIMRASKDQVQHYLGHKVEGAERLRSLPKSYNHIWDSVGIAYCKFLLLLGQGDTGYEIRFNGDIRDW